VPTGPEQANENKSETTQSTPGVRACSKTPKNTHMHVPQGLHERDNCTKTNNADYYTHHM